MRGYSVIVDKVEMMDIVSGIDFEVDTKGLNCKIKPVGGGIAINTKPSTTGSYPIADGEELDFCGRLFFRHASNSPVVHLLYYHTL